MANSSAKLREQLLTGSGKADKTPPVADGVLSVTPDSGDIVQWRSTSVLDAAETSSSYLDDDDGGAKRAATAAASPCPRLPACLTSHMKTCLLCAGPKPHELYGKVILGDPGACPGLHAWPSQHAVGQVSDLVLLPNAHSSPGG